MIRVIKKDGTKEDFNVQKVVVAVINLRTVHSLNSQMRSWTISVVS